MTDALERLGSLPSEALVTAVAALMRHLGEQPGCLDTYEFRAPPGDPGVRHVSARVLSDGSLRLRWQPEATEQPSASAGMTGKPLHWYRVTLQPLTEDGNCAVRAIAAASYGTGTDGWTVFYDHDDDPVQAIMQHSILSIERVPGAYLHDPGLDQHHVERLAQAIADRLSESWDRDAIAASARRYSGSEILAEARRHTGEPYPLDEPLNAVHPVRKPRVGDSVHYVPYPEGSDGERRPCWAATVTAVIDARSGRAADLLLMPPDRMPAVFEHDSSARFGPGTFMGRKRTATPGESLPLITCDDLAFESGSWHWPS